MMIAAVLTKSGVISPPIFTIVSLTTAFANTAASDFLAA